MFVAPIGHVGDLAAGDGSGWVISVMFVALLAALTVQHFAVKTGSTSTREVARQSGTAVVALVAMSALVFGLAESSGAQSSGRLVGLPDLISDPPEGSWINEITIDGGSVQRVLTFNGYVHNIGDGPLDVSGNPQRPGGMKQRVWNGDEWTDVGEPTVRYEEDDGHNHFHLIEAVDYVLWDGQRSAQTIEGSKIGFCLVDSEVAEDRTPAEYDEDQIEFCKENQPDATALRMGISPGWRDIYDDTTTLQWVNISNVAPGRYWLGAITDPNDEIVESNEDNNALIFSRDTVVVPGWAPMTVSGLIADDGPLAVDLPTTPFGQVGPPSFTIVEAPKNGSLDVPVDAALTTSRVIYTPTAGFSGVDEFVFTVRDSTSAFPDVAPEVTVQITVEGEEADPAPPLDQAPASLSTSTTFYDVVVGERIDEPVEMFTDDEASRMFASGLPTGLRVDEATSAIVGRPTSPGIYQAELIAFGPQSNGRQAITFNVRAVSAGDGLAVPTSVSSARGERSRIRFAPTELGASFEADGLPPGITLESGSPLLSGVPEEVGSFDVTVRRTSGGATDEATFTWDIRTPYTIGFAL